MSSATLSRETSGRLFMAYCKDCFEKQLKIDGLIEENKVHPTKAYFAS